MEREVQPPSLVQLRIAVLMMMLVTRDPGTDIGVVKQAAKIPRL
jgi:hypothetical protein